MENLSLAVLSELCCARAKQDVINVISDCDDLLAVVELQRRSSVPLGRPRPPAAGLIDHAHAEMLVVGV